MSTPSTASQACSVPAVSASGSPDENPSTMTIRMLRLRNAAAYSASAIGSGASYRTRAKRPASHCQQGENPVAFFSIPPYGKSPAMSIDVSKEKLAADLKVVVADAEELLRATASQAGEKVGVARERIQASLASARVKLADTERAVLDKTKIAAKATDEYVHENPWQAVGVAAVIGFLLGALITRR
jgi:ElaB/YqjD/DUF883 family membrane-anchored ribosome-binding protein